MPSSLPLITMLNTSELAKTPAFPPDCPVNKDATPEITQICNACKPATPPMPPACPLATIYEQDMKKSSE